MTDRIADTGYLLAFGAVPDGRFLLRELFGAEVSAPPAVHWELKDVHEGGRHPLDVKEAASVALGFEIPVESIEASDVGPRLQTWRTLGRQAADSFPEERHPPTDPGFIVGDHAGESEAIAVAIRLLVPLLINDAKARAHAIDCGLIAEPSPISLRRLVGRHSPRDLFEIHKKMDAVAKSKIPVPGMLWFTEDFE